MPASTPDFFDEGALVGVLTAQPLDRVLDYKAPEGGCQIGAFVEVPLGPRKVLGVVWGAGQGDYALSKIRSVIRVLDVAPMREEMQMFLARAADYTLTPMTAMLRLATRAPGLSDPPSMRKVYRLGHGAPDRVTAARTRVLDTLEAFGGLSFTLKELSDEAGVTSSVVKGLVKQGAVSEEDAPQCGTDRAIRHNAPARGDRVRQDRSVSGGGRRNSAPRPSGAGPFTRDRPDGRVSHAC